MMILFINDIPFLVKAFEESVEKDKMMAVAHFMLGNINLSLDR